MHVYAIISFSNQPICAFFHRVFLRDVVDTANVFIKMMERFCQDAVVVQDKRRGAAGKRKKKKKQQASNKPSKSSQQPTEVSGKSVKIEFIFNAYK